MSDSWGGASDPLPKVNAVVKSDDDSFTVRTALSALDDGLRTHLRQGRLALKKILALHFDDTDTQGTKASYSGVLEETVSLDIPLVNGDKRKMEVTIILRATATLEASVELPGGKHTWPGTSRASALTLQIPAGKLGAAICKAIATALNPPDGSEADPTLDGLYRDVLPKRDPGWMFKDYGGTSWTCTLPIVSVDEASLAFIGTYSQGRGRSSMENEQGESMLVVGSTVAGAGFTTPHPPQGALSVIFP